MNKEIEYLRKQAKEYEEIARSRKILGCKELCIFNEGISMGLEIAANMLSVGLEKYTGVSDEKH